MMERPTQAIITTTVPMALRLRLEALARQNGRDLAAEVTAALEAWAGPGGVGPQEAAAAVPPAPPPAADLLAEAAAPHRG